jgi:hypothetical protein
MELTRIPDFFSDPFLASRHNQKDHPSVPERAQERDPSPSVGVSFCLFAFS